MVELGFDLRNTRLSRLGLKKRLPEPKCPIGECESQNGRPRGLDSGRTMKDRTETQLLDGDREPVPSRPPDNGGGAGKLLRAVTEVQTTECSDIFADLQRARGILREASSELLESFQLLTADAVEQQQQVKQLLVAMSGAVHEGDRDGLNIAAFVSQTATVLRNFAELLAHFSKQSLTISFKIDDMVQHMDDIFDLVSQVDSIAEETNVLAINAALEAARAGEAGKGFTVVASEVRLLSRNTKLLNEKIGDRVDSARAVIDDVRDAAREIASQDMSMALTAKGDVDEMLDRMRAMERRVSNTLDEVTEFADRVRTSADSATRTMPLEDVVEPLLGHLAQRVDGLRTLLEQVNGALTVARTDPHGHATLSTAIERVRAQRSRGSAVEQRSTAEGDLELF